MSKFIGGHQRRSERKIVQRDRTRRCSFCHASLEHEKMPRHICKEVTYQSMPILNFIPFEVD